MDEFKAEAASWMYALEGVPTFHLGSCFERAIRTHTSQYPLLASDVLRIYEEVKQEVAERQVLMQDAIGARIGLPELTEGEAQQEEQEQMDRYNNMSLKAWKKYHNLPDEWILGDPYPEESDLYKEGEAHLLAHQESEEMAPMYAGVLAEKYWHKRKMAPWELIPNKEEPEVRKVGVKKTLRDAHGHRSMMTVWHEYKNWVERCSEIDYGEAVPCPGFVIEHYGPDGKWERKLPCPLHQDRRR